jgi:hypothetical protein
MGTDIKLEHHAETVQGLLTFEFGTGNEIVVGGLSAFPLSGKGLIRGKSYMSARFGRNPRIRRRQAHTHPQAALGRPQQPACFG